MRHTRVRVFAVCLAVLLGFETSRPPEIRAQVPPPPNVIVVMLDDEALGALVRQMQLGVLPNMAFVASKGVWFSNSFATHPLCAPSRATFLTGQYPHRNGVTSNGLTILQWGGAFLALNDTNTVATSVQGVLRPGAVGKQMNGAGGDDTAPLTSPRNPLYRPPGWDSFVITPDPDTYHTYNYRVVDNGVIESHGQAPEDYQVSVLANKAVQFVTDSIAQNRRFMLWFTPRAPHFDITTAQGFGTDSPSYSAIWHWHPIPDVRYATSRPDAWNKIFQMPLLPQLNDPSFNEGDVSDKPVLMQKPLMTSDDITEVTKGYRLEAASVLSVDDAIGALLTALGSERANSVICVTSDNGFQHGQHRFSEKSTVYENSFRVPLFCAGAGILGVPVGMQGPRVVNALVLNNDLRATIEELAGVPRDPIEDGRSLVPLLKNATAPWGRKRFLIEHVGEVDSPFEVPTYAAVRTGPTDPFPGRKYVKYADGSCEFYDLNVDPFELNNLCGNPTRAAEIAVFEQYLAALRTCETGDACRAAEE